MAKIEPIELTGHGQVSIVSECFVGWSESGYVALQIKGGGTYALPVATARELALALLEKAAFLEQRKN